MLRINKSELKTNKTLITPVTNVLFYKVDKNRRPYSDTEKASACISVPMQEIIHYQNIKQRQH